MRRRNLPEARHCDAGTLAMARMHDIFAAILGRPSPAPQPDPWRVPVPSPRFLCPVHDVEWNGPGGCFICDDPSQPSQREEPS